MMPSIPLNPPEPGKALRASIWVAKLEQAIINTSVTAPIIVNITSSTCSGSIHWLSVRLVFVQFLFWTG